MFGTLNQFHSTYLNHSCFLSHEGSLRIKIFTIGLETRRELADKV